MPGRIAIPVGLSSHHLTAAQVAAASQAAVLEQLRDKLETGEPPEKKVALTVEEQQRLMQHALQHNLLAVASQFPMNIKVSNRGSTAAPSMVTLSPGTGAEQGVIRMLWGTMGTPAPWGRAGGCSPRCRRGWVGTAR